MKPGHIIETRFELDSLPDDMWIQVEWDTGPSTYPLVRPHQLGWWSEQSKSNTTLRARPDIRLLPATDHTRCVKCGDDDIHTRHHWHHFQCPHRQRHDEFTDREHLHYECLSCGFSWTGPTLDADQPDDVDHDVMPDPQPRRNPRELVGVVSRPHDAVCKACGGDGFKHGFTETRPGIGRIPCLSCNGSGLASDESG